MNTLTRGFIVKLGLAAIAVAGLAALAGTAAAGNRLNSLSHWPDADRPNAWVTYVDHTGPAWPVQAAANEWDFAGHLAVIYHHAPGCGGHGHCVSVDAIGNSSDSCGPVRAAWAGASPNGNHWKDAAIVLNNGCKSGHGSRDLRVLTCQEEGNVAGLKDEPKHLADSTCMGDNKPLGQTEETPRHHDFVMLDDRIYDHND